MTTDAPALPHILVVDDSGGVRRSLQRALSPYMRVTVAESAAEALSLLTPCVQLVLSDILMPGESGFDLTARLRKDYPELPVVLFTGVVEAETRSRAQALGVDTVLRKPLLTGPLLKVIQEWVGELPDQPQLSGSVVPRAVPGSLADSPVPAPAPTLLAETVSVPETLRIGEPLEASEAEVDRLGQVCRQSGVLCAALFTLDGQVARQWKLPLPPEIGERAVKLMGHLEGCAALLGAAWQEGQLMHLPLTDRVMLVGRVENECLVLVVRDAAVALEVARKLQDSTVMI